MTRAAWEHGTAMCESSCGPLGRWYATPLSPEEARSLLRHSAYREAERARRGLSCITCRLQLMAARFWLGRPAEDDYEMLVARLPMPGRGRALVELIYGQLLMSRRLPGAALHLRTGFEMASSRFGPGDYFRVLERHRLLLRLPLSQRAHPPATLKELVVAARVVERLGGESSRPGQRTDHRTDPGD